MLLSVRRALPGEREWVKARLRERWGSELISSRERSRDASELAVLICEDEREPVGLATFELRGGECELVTLDAFKRGAGAGSLLLARVLGEARSRGAERLWLITTNDNLDALRFYQRRGLELVAVHRGALTRARELKPDIPLVGEHGIPIRDELELEVWLKC